VTEFLEVKTTAGSREEAETIGRAAVDARLAACAQIGGPISSVYWWDGKVEQATEWVCTLKAPAQTFERLEQLIKRTSSYDTPEVIATPIVLGSAEYLRWIEAEAPG
jgi:periplasmic divalent cation tolerance protein